jgi:hypothetical protein
VIFIGKPPGAEAIAAEQIRLVSQEETAAGKSARNSQRNATTVAEEASPRTVAVPSVGVSEVEQIAALQRTIEADQAHLHDLEAKLKEHEAEFESASEQFRKLEDQLEEHRGKIEQLSQAGEDSEAAELQSSTPDLEKQCTLAKERLEAAVQLRKATQEQIATLREKIERDQHSLQKLLGAEQPPTEPKEAAPTAATPASADSGEGESVSERVSGGEAPTPTPEQSPVVPPQAPAAGAKIPAEKEAAPGIDDVDDEEIAEARAEVAATEKAAEKAKEQVEDIEQRLETLDRSIRLEQQAREAARKQADNAEQTLALLGQELERKLAEDATRRELDDLRSKMQEAQSRLQLAREELRKRTTEFDRLQAERAGLLADRIASLRKLEEDHRRAEAAREKLESLENPFAPRNVLSWMAEHGPPILAILLGIWVIRWLLRAGMRRLVRVLVLAGGRGNDAEREERADILAGILNKIGVFLVLIGGALLILAELGIEIAPLWTLISAVLAMIAIGFVAVWSVVSNTLCALMLLVCQPFKVGSTVELVGAGVRGKVVNFNLIYTTLRDEQGDLIEVPNNAFFQQPIRHREKGTCTGLKEQLTEQADAR